MKTLTLKSLYSTKTFVVAMAVAVICMIGLTIPLKTEAATTIPLCEITRSLSVGSSGVDVQCLQRYLNWAGFTIAATGPGSPGSETQYFGSLTENAVIKYQNTNALQVLSPAGLTTGTGYFGPLSFAWYVSIVRTQLGLSPQ